MERRSAITLSMVSAAGALIFATTANAAVDAAAARALAKSNDCFKCHAIDKTKKGPSYKSVAEKLKGKADAESKIITNITTGPKIKLEDGTVENHKIIDTNDPKALKNLADWILSL